MPRTRLFPQIRQWHLIREYAIAFPERIAGRSALPGSMVSTARSVMKEYLEESILDKAYIDPYAYEDLEVKIGFVTGTGCRAQHDEWYSAYLYCRQDDESRSLNAFLKDWAWRVCIFQSSVENPMSLYGQYPRFNFIPEFLNWYSGWLDYVDIKVFRKNVRRHWGDDDYDSDME